MSGAHRRITALALALALAPSCGPDEEGLESAEGESAIFAHDGGRVVLQEGGVDGLAVEGDAVVQRQDDPDEGILADLLAAISGPKLAEAKAALAAWREGQLTRGAKGD